MKEVVMGWSDSRVTLFPPRWRPRTEVAPRGRTADGAPVHLLHAHRDESVAGGLVDSEAVAEWLRERGFESRERFTKIVTLGREDLEIDLFADGGELSHAVITFGLSRESPARWEKWQTFVDEFCADWKLELADAEVDRKVGASELFHVLARTPSWQDFQHAFAWPSAIQSSK
jgi:hypothetical protein